MSLRHYLRRAPALDAREALALVEEGAVVVDVRRDFEWRRTHVPGAVHVPLDELPARLLELPEDRLLITFCTGGIRSAAAANLLREHGFDAVNLTRGLIDWRSAGGPLSG